MRTLIITTKRLYPPAGGAALRIWQNTSALMSFGSVGVFCVTGEPENPEIALITPPGVTFWYCHQLKTRKSTSRLERRRELFQALLSRTDRLTRRFYQAAAASKLKQVLNEFKPDLVVFEELWGCSYLSIVQKYPCRIVYDAHNAETDLLRQFIAQTETNTRLRDRLDAWLRLSLVEWVERRMTRAVDQIWACSEFDIPVLQALSQKSPSIVVIPNAVDMAYYASVRDGNQSLPPEFSPYPHTLIFTATFSYIPNAVAAQWLIEVIFPKLVELYPDCRLLLVGAEPTPLMQAAAQKNPGIVVTGRVPDMRSYLALATVAIVPLLQGSGTRLKILEAFAAGVPVVSTAKGVEGIAAADGVHLLIRDTADDLVAGIDTLWQKPETRQKLMTAAYELVQMKYSWSAIQSEINQALAPLIGDNNQTVTSLASTQV